MAYETIIGWRYLYRRTRPHRKLLLALLLVFVGVAVTTALFWLVAGWLPPASVFVFTLASIGAIVCAVVSVFSIFTSVSVFGVVLGVSALTIVMSVTSGFQAAFQDKVLGVNAHVLVMRTSAGGFSMYKEVEKLAKSIDGVVAVQPFVFVEMLITRGKGELSGIAMKGVDPDRLGTVLDLPKHMQEGTVALLKEHPAGEPPSIIVGRELAHKLKAKVGDDVTLVLPSLSFDTRPRGERAISAPGVAKTRKFRVRGIFYSGFDEYDRRLVYISIKDAQEFTGEGDTVTGVEMKVADVNRARQIARTLDRKLGGEPFMVVDWRELNNNLFTALTIQKTVLLVVLTLIIVVAAFNIVAALTMMVVDKTKEIAILKSMGANASGVARLFQVVGMTIGGIGTVLGLGLGMLLCTVVAHYGYPLDPKVYLIDQLPIHVDPYEVVLVGAITLVICFVATLYPALKASSLRPVEGLRYE
jgi:lipoprotein-releasing system permease protein